ncbi:MAG: SAVED domain-containing protein [Pirellulales bacterium]
MGKTAPKSQAKKASAVSTGDNSPREVTRYIKPAVTAVLWGRAAGRCEFAGCNRPLWKSTVTQEPVNVAQQAHIYSFSENGPRGNAGVSDEELNSTENLMLVCHPCHRKIDQHEDGGRYTASLLKSMKHEHERRVEIVTGISSDRQSHVLFYGANIGEQSSPLKFAEAGTAMFPESYPASDQAIELGLTNSAATDRSPEYWIGESRQLQALFDRRVRERITAGDISHLSVFALAPQPLLILLGTHLGDIVPAAIYQRHREPPSWAWPNTADPITYVIAEPENTVGIPALVLGVSATVTPDRITSVLGANASIWTISVPTPHNDIIKSPAHLSEFRAVMWPLLDRIKAKHGQDTPLHIFPAAPISVAVELGRIRMPKADMPWQIYDQSNALGGFVQALTIE